MSLPSHALVLPDADFAAWYAAAEPYTRAFERVSIIRGLRGVDLNRFHTITAITAPSLWVANDPLTHIRRAFPAVVRVDVVRVATPGNLAAALADRITRRDRYAEYLRDDHLNTRFTVRWPCDGRPAKIITPFNLPITDANGRVRPNEGLIYHAPAGAAVRAAASGTVLLIGQDASGLGWGSYAVVGSTHVVSTSRSIGYQVIYTNVQGVALKVGQTILVGAQVGNATGPTSRLIVVQVGTSTPGYALNGVIDPTPLIEWPELRVRTSVDGLRLRERPGTAFRSIGQLYIGDLLEPLELPGKTLEKLGDDDSWLRVRTPLNLTGFAAAWLLTATAAPSLAGVDFKGMNLDLLHPQGAPPADRLRGIAWLRLPYKATVSQGFGGLDSAHTFYEPRLRRYAEAGHRLIVILTHQTFGEGMGYNWETMYGADRGRWNDFIPRFAETAKQIARRYAGTGIVTAYQVWNEQDTPAGLGVAAVPMQAEDYARLLAETTLAIRSVDPTAQVITGGHITGPVDGTAYARAVVARLPQDAIPDGIACHSYGRGAPTSDPAYVGFGSIAEEVNAYERVLTGVPVWVTEWGVLDRNTDSPEAVARYVREFFQFLRGTVRRKVVTTVWYAFADTMHNGYGVVDQTGAAKFPLYDDYING